MSSSSKEIKFKYVGTAILLSGVVTFFQQVKTSEMQIQLCEDTKTSFITLEGKTTDMLNALKGNYELTDKEKVIDNANGARSACVYAYKSLKPTFFQEWILMFVFLWGLMTYVRILNTKNNK